MIHQVKSYRTFLIDNNRIWIEDIKSLGEEERYHLQHSIAFQIWDMNMPHFQYQHGRSPEGYNPAQEELEQYKAIQNQFH